MWTNGVLDAADRVGGTEEPSRLNARPPDNDDRGWNMIQVRLPWSRNANLHRAWDTDFVEHAFGGKNEKLVAHELLLKFASRKNGWQTGMVQAWMERHWYHYPLHNKRAEILKWLLLSRGNRRIVIVKRSLVHQA